MFVLEYLDSKNDYNPNLQDPKVSALVSYTQANLMYNTINDNLKDIETKILFGTFYSEKDIYVLCHNIATGLALCCEQYLKALYIYENISSGYQAEELWNKLKNSDYLRDSNGNLIYKTQTGKLTFARYDEQGKPITDSNGNTIYFDEDDNTYNENNRGAKIKRNGHDLGRLIELLSPGSRFELEMKMLKTPMRLTEKYKSVSIVDVLLAKGVLSRENKISSEQYVNWVEQHKKVFEEARYSGQKKSNVNLEFLYHLTTQIRAVVQYKMQPNNNQNFTITEEEAKQLPEDIKQIVSYYSNLMSEDLIRLIMNNEEIKDKIKRLLSKGYDELLENVSPLNFYNMVKLMNNDEIIYVLRLCYMIQNYNQIKKEHFNEEEQKTFEIAKVFRIICNQSNETTIRLLVEIKEALGESVSVDNESVGILLEKFALEHINSNYKKYNITIGNTIDNAINEPVTYINNKTYK